LREKDTFIIVIILDDDDDDVPPLTRKKLKKKVFRHVDWNLQREKKKKKSGRL